MTREKYFIVGLLILATSCGAILQNTAIKDFKDPITKSVYYQSLNKYQQDFVYLKTICEKYFPMAEQYFPLEKRKKIEADILTRLSAKRISDLDFRLLLKSYISHFDNQHARISMTGLTITGIYPFIPFNKDSSWYILNLAEGQNRNFIGKKIIAFNGISINDYEKRLFQFVSAENETSKRKEINNWWNRPAIHEFLAGKSIDSIKLTLEGGEFSWLKKIKSGKIEWILNEKDFKHHAITKYKDRIYDYQVLSSFGLTYFQFHECYDKIEIKEGMKTYLKPWLRPLANLYVNVQTRKKKPSYRLKRYFDPERPVFSEYIDKMITDSNEKGIKKLIIDLRNNNGGSENICLQLLYHFTERGNLKDFSEYVKNDDFYKYYFKNDYQDKINFYSKLNGKMPVNDSLFFSGFSNSKKQLLDKIEDTNSPYYVIKNRPVFKGKIVIIADQTTHSAGALFATLLQDNEIGMIIGNEVSNNPTGPTAWTPFRLPNSRVQASIASTYLVRPDPKRGKKFVPDVKIEKSIEDLFNGTDPLFDKAVEILGKQ